MSPLVASITVLLYLAFLFAISYITSRKNDNSGFFVGGRQSSWIVVSIATIGSTISGVTFVSVPGMVQTNGFAYLQMVMGFVVGQFLIAYVLVPMYYRLKLVSVYEYLKERFGMNSYHTGAWFFFISKMLGAAVRVYLVCLTLQILIFEPLGIPFILNAAVTMLVVWLYTYRGGVKTVIWTDLFKTLCLVLSVVLCIYFIAQGMGYNLAGVCQSVFSDDMSRIFFFDDINDRRFFPKQFFAGVFTIIATTGLDQDLMQRNLSCKNSSESRKNMMVSILLQFIVISLFLMLGVLLYTYASFIGLDSSGYKGDEIFTKIATGGYLPMAVGILFLIGLIAAAFGAAGSALTALTTSFTVDILNADRSDETATARKRKMVHVFMALVMALVIYMFNRFNNTSVIDAVYILASYTYGPILGMFVFGIFIKRQVKDKWIPLVAIIAPILCFIVDRNSQEWFNGYRFSYELLILNAAFTFVGLYILSSSRKQ
ncbi:MAG: sodium:solute symporter [Prevotellaceae bacterium]|nr:sodium:solute symporter [Prevotellaceae bacterium]